MSEGPKPNRALNLEFVKELYLQELENKHKLDSRMATLVVILSAIAGLILYAVGTFTPGAGWFNVLTIVSLIAAGGLWVAAFVHLILGTLGHEYERIPSAKDIEGTFTKLHGYHSSNPAEPGTAQTSLDETLIERMLEATDRNRDCNLTRGARYYTAMLLMAWAVASGVLAGTAVTVAAKLHDFHGKGAYMSNEQKPAETPQASGQQPAQQPAHPTADSTKPAEKPALPPNTLFKGNDLPASTRVITGETPKKGGKSGASNVRRRR